MKLTAPIAIGLALLAGACSQRSGWSVDGVIADANNGTKLALEANNAGLWYLIDSLEVAQNGSFEYQSEQPLHFAEVMRLSLDGNSIYFPVDSVDAVTVTANATTFGHGHSLTGTQTATTFATIDSLVANTSDLETLQRTLTGIIATDTTGIVAYYAVGKAIGGRPVFDAASVFGNRVYGAAAQVYAQYHPEAPQATALRRMYFAGRQLLGKIPAPEQTVVEVPETGILDIKRYDSRGNEHILSEVAKDGVTLLSFTAYGLPSSPAYNSILNSLYDKYADKGLKIYQLSFDDDEVAWKEAARNLPWITVWNAPTDGNVVLVQYNVGALPMTFIINRQGEVVERVVNPEELAQKISKYI